MGALGTPHSLLHSQVNSAHDTSDAPNDLKYMQIVEFN